MGDITTRGWRSTGRGRICRLGRAALILLALIVLPAAVAQADATWTGAASSAAWSSGTNWLGGVAPSSPAGTLTFPTLGSCATCYSSTNNISGISTSGLVLRNTSGNYQIGGASVDVGAGGITDTAGGGPGDSIKAPLVLTGGPQTWAVGGGNGYNSLTLLGGVSETSSHAVTVKTPDGDLFVDSNMEVGPVTSNGPGTLHIGGSPTSGSPGSINGTTGSPLTISRGRLIPNPNSTSGPLTMSSGTTLLLGTNISNTGTTTLVVNGAASLSSSSTTQMFINGNGATAGTDFSQLRASGNITVGGQLVLGQGGAGQSNGPCQTLKSGDVATLVTASGALTGTFANAPNGAILTMASSCQTNLPHVQVQYTANSVTATVVSGTTPSTPTTTTLATPSPSPATTNQPVTLTATVTTSSGSPSGTMAFSASGNLIPGCTSQPIAVSGSSGTATCSTSFAATGSPERLTATFTDTPGSGQISSTSSAQTLTVARTSTTTTLAASNTSPPVRGSVTYTATVAPDPAGASVPSGTVAFLDNNSSISGCTARTVTVGASSETATCTLSYPRAGKHTITAAYRGDGNFMGSSSPVTMVTPIAFSPAGGRSIGRIVGPGGRLTVTGRRIRFTQKCESGARCRGSFSFTVDVRTGKHRRLVLVRCASGTFQIRGRRSTIIRVRLTAACLRLLRAQRHHRMTVLYTSRTKSGQSGQRKRVTLVLR